MSKPKLFLSRSEARRIAFGNPAKFEAYYYELQKAYRETEDMLKKCNDQMQYYSGEIRDNPASWNEVMDDVAEFLDETNRK